ncbi:hypothetical protein [Streptomyces sp. NPDC003299]
MNKNIAKRLAIAFGSVAVLAGSTTQALATTGAPNDPASTPSSYVNYLRHSHEPGAAQTLVQFQALTPGQQQEFVGYLHDPKVLKSFMDQVAKPDGGLTANSQSENTTTSLKGGDVTFQAQRAVVGARASKPLPKGAHWASYTYTFRIHGIAVVAFKLAVNFHSNGKDIDKVNYAEATKKNFTGVINVSHDRPKTWLGTFGFCTPGHPCSRGHLAGASVIWEGTIASYPFTMQIDKKQYMTANVYGTVTDASFKTA